MARTENRIEMPSFENGKVKTEARFEREMVPEEAAVRRGLGAD